MQQSEFNDAVVRAMAGRREQGRPYGLGELRELVEGVAASGDGGDAAAAALLHEARVLHDSAISLCPRMVHCDSFHETFVLVDWDVYGDVLARTQAFRDARTKFRAFCDGVEPGGDSVRRSVGTRGTKRLRQIQR